MFGDSPHSPAFAVSFAGYFAVSSFLLVYLWTRSQLRGVLQAADADLNERIEHALTNREDANARALSFVDRQLTGNNPPSQAELNEAIGAATPDWLIQIFRRAEDQRHKNWRTDKAEMARTIPVFRALVAADKDSAYFRHFASLGFALKDLEQPDYAEAQERLTQAINIRGTRRRVSADLLEWNRAVCRIRLDSQFADGKPSTPEAREAIAADLRASARLPSTFSQDPVVTRWTALNNLDV